MFWLNAVAADLVYRPHLEVLLEAEQWAIWNTPACMDHYGSYSRHFVFFMGIIITQSFSHLPSHHSDSTTNPPS